MKKIALCHVLGVLSKQVFFVNNSLIEFFFKFVMDMDTPKEAVSYTHLTLPTILLV